MGKLKEKSRITLWEYGKQSFPRFGHFPRLNLFKKPCLCRKEQEHLLCL